MTWLVLNRRPILHRLAEWFPDDTENMVVFTDRSAVNGASLQQLSHRFRQVIVTDDYELRGAPEQLETLCSECGVTRVLTTAERDLVRAARLREKFGLPGQSVQSALAYTNKHIMKSIAAAAGVPVADMRRVTCGDQLLEFAADHGFPVVVKPIAGGGSVGIAVCDDIAAITRVANIWDEQRWAGRGEDEMLIEAWVKGDLYHVDGVMADCRVVQSWPSLYLTPPVQKLISGAHVAGGMIHEDHSAFQPLQEATARVVDALPPPPGQHPFHAEFFVSESGSGPGKLSLCEIACRAGGGSIPLAHERSFGFNLHHVDLAGHAGRSVPIPPGPPRPRHGYAEPAPRPGVLLSAPNRCPLPQSVHYKLIGRVGRRYGAPQYSNDYVALVVFTLSDEDMAEELRAVLRWWESEVEWST
jgi:Carbamoyl-phosphate synthase L chain, ATP binding domain